VRTFSEKVREQIRDRMRTIAAGMAAAFQVEIKVEIRDIFSVLINHEEQAHFVADVARDVVGNNNVLTTPTPKMGSEDFADMLLKVPGAYFWLGHEGSVPLHNPGFILDDGILPVGASLFSRIIEQRMPLVA
jgi:hippurate hydrolase